MVKILKKKLKPEQQKRYIYIQNNAVKKSIDNYKYKSVIRLNNIM